MVGRSFRRRYRRRNDAPLMFQRRESSMLLALDMGNTNITLGIYEGKTLRLQSV